MIWELTPLALIVGVALLMRARKREPIRTGDDWLIAGAKLGLRQTASDLQGSSAGVAVHIRQIPSFDGLPQTVFAIGKGMIAFGLTASPNAFGKRSAELGDESFDERFEIQGPREEIFATFSSNVRTRFLELGDVRISDGELFHSRFGSLSTESIIAIVEHLVALVQAMRSEPSSLGARLLSAIEMERHPVVKDRALRVLFTSIKEESIVARAAELALAAEAPETRLLGACIAGDRGRSVLEALVCDGGVSEEVRVQALAKLPRAHIADNTLLALRETADLQLRVAIISRLVSEDALLIALDDPREEAQTAAARGLEAVGTLTSVEALNARTIGLLRSGVLKSAARDAVRAIQARASGAESGRLSIATEDDRGALSVAGEGGALSEVER